jgi:hypothetical protein
MSNTEEVKYLTVSQVGRQYSSSEAELRELLASGWREVRCTTVDEWVDAEGYSGIQFEYELRKP